MHLVDNAHSQKVNLSDWVLRARGREYERWREKGRENGKKGRKEKVG